MNRFVLSTMFLLTLLLLTGCGGNKYLKNFQSFNGYDYLDYPETDDCRLINVEAKAVLENKTITIADLREKIEADGYKLIGMSTKNPVPLNQKHQRKVLKACREVGADIALYDNGRQILYFRDN